MYGRLTLTTESHRIVYPWDVLLREKQDLLNLISGIKPFPAFVTSSK
jgi:hypothetical protein